MIEGRPFCVGGVDVKGMAARVRVEGLVVAYTALADATNACDAVDEVVVAADDWAGAKSLLRSCGYLGIPTRATSGRIPADAVGAALSDPGTVFRRHFRAVTPWAPAEKRG
ncbi:hypothetical protein [Streptomyces lavenduligriseus]|uniref:Uncharacterized protein n=1 Tax=Streptomyces lavenduligriseus TaxID=67315 RepID=A0ABT0NN10_9ACTN|nr:hypothetical protein [Streptomyces lavenduligriseus]MCL3992840.1 hypothetical protein [Streptomyces lavenduligriseus]